MKSYYAIEYGLYDKGKIQSSGSYYLESEKLLGFYEMLDTVKANIPPTNHALSLSKMQGITKEEFKKLKTQ